jgi:hypothetical protein
MFNWDLNPSYDITKPNEFNSNLETEIRLWFCTSKLPLSANTQGVSET